MNDQQLTREGLIWQAAKSIASAEKKQLVPTSMGAANTDREYVLTLLRQVAAAVDGKEAR
ncbi:MULTISPECIES: hypothetical protein [Acetobacter]|uniref:Uncharacterized protein n=1 Tax=Acetobacter oryzoeni TaxID=2500548 RepID=A0A5B9GQT6_9PROT|nr:hypothetical protein [Acetobacter oryzoeni]MCP1202245.1 hypothetical protein [Acetobacter oryzoeni]QEE85975.1 hypothetical protein EOV40_009830 [Acetobacter oryzoeni]